MNAKSQSIIIIPILIIGFALAQNAQALNPPPDGGYPGGNTAEGQNALFSLTSGGYNTAVGWFSLRNDTTSNFNTAVGAGTLFANSGDENTATGTAALLSNTTGVANTANGAFALLSNTAGAFNTANGDSALFSNTVGAQNTATGFNTLTSNTSGSSNTANGAYALANNTTGYDNTANGASALNMNTTGSDNTANGFNALLLNRTGNNNIALGASAGQNLTTGSHNIYIGNLGGTNDESRKIRIGTVGGQNATFIAGISGGTVPDGVGVIVGSNGKLGTVVSSERFKHEIKPMDKASEAILALRPVTFRYKQELDPDGIPQFGLVAEDVEKVNPDLVVRDKQGKPYTVRYEAVNAMLLNEFLKEHRKVQEQEATITQLNKDFRTTVTQLTARLDEQAAQIQKVSAQLEASKPASQVVNNP